MAQRISSAALAVVIGVGVYGAGLAQAGDDRPTPSELREAKAEVVVHAAGGAWSWKRYGGVFGSTRYEVSGVARVINADGAWRIDVDGLGVNERGTYDVYLTSTSAGAVKDKATPRGTKLATVSQRTRDRSWEITARDAERGAAIVVFDTEEERVAGVLSLSEGDVISSGHAWADAQKDTSGGWEIIRREDGVYLRLADDFKTARPPEPLSVLLTGTRASGVNKRNAERGAVKVGTLGSHTGAQELRLPDGLDASEYASLVLWCKPYEVVFGVSALHGDAS